MFDFSDSRKNHTPVVNATKACENINFVAQQSKIMLTYVRRHFERYYAKSMEMVTTILLLWIIFSGS